MSDTVTPKQALILWKMITAETDEEREPLQSKVRPELPPKERARLIDRGFLTAERIPKGRGKKLVLTDKAWAWAERANDVELMKSSVGAEALQGLLRRMLPFLQRHELPLATLFQPGASNPAAPTADAVSATPDSGPSSAALPSQIEAACLSLAGGARKTRVRLSALRKQLDAITRDVLDGALLDLQDRGRLVLYRDDNTAALTAEDHHAALMVGDAPRHLVLLEA